MEPYRLTTLPNGVRIATIEMPHMQSVSLGVWAGVGGRYEPARLCGIAHFIEHLLFKGTARRNAKQITEAVEGLGGYLNAFTTEDHTCFYAKAPARHLPVLGDVLADMVLHSQFAPAEIERERDVIREEIMMVHDNPDQHVQELLSETLWPRHPLGRPLTGTATTINGLDRDTFLQFKERYYNGRSTIVTAAGRLSHEAVVAQLGPVFGTLPRGRTPRFAAAPPPPSRRARPVILLRPQEIEQTHLALGFHAFGRGDDRRYALKLLSVILGENMSSRLFQRLRERHGYCYSIQSSVVSLADSGALTLFAGLDPSKLQKAIQAILEEVERIARRAPSRSELKKAQDYTIGQTFMGLESTSNQIMWMGESLLGYGKVMDPAEVERRLLAVTPEAVRSVAEFCLQRARLALTVVGPSPDEATIRGWL